MNVALGALRVGLVPVFVKPQLTEPERRFVLEDSEPTLTLGDTEMEQAVTSGSRAELAEVPLSRPMLYTSGTTGRPKGVWTDVLTESNAKALVDEESDLWDFDPLDVHLVVSELTHSAPFRFAMGALLQGGSVVLSGGVANAAAAMKQFRVTSTFLAPAHLHRLRTGAQALAVDRFRLVAHAGAPCPRPIKEWAIETFPSGSVWEFYGATEGQFTVCSPQDYEERPESVGRARPGRVVTSDADGVLWCEVPDFARFRYWRDAERTEHAWQGRSFSVGDLGTVDSHGFVRLEGRRNDLIISGGVNVYPLEVERVMAECPGVMDVAVFGIGSERWGQQVCAAVVGPVEEAALRLWIDARLARYKHPKQILSVVALPHGPTGKLRRPELGAHLGLE